MGIQISCQIIESGKGNPTTQGNMVDFDVGTETK